MKDKEPQEDVLNRVEKKAGDYMENGKGNCAQGAFFALKEEFNLGDDMIIKALDAMTPSVNGALSRDADVAGTLGEYEGIPSNGILQGAVFSNGLAGIVHGIPAAQ